MTATVPTIEPLELRAGLTWQWRRENISDYPASVWTLTYWFKKIGTPPGNFSIVATADGDNFAVSVSATTTQSFAPGDYTWAAVVSAAGEKIQVNDGRFTVLARYDQVANVDDRSHARKMLDAIEAELEGMATSAQISMLEYNINTRGYKQNSDILLTWRGRYRAEVRREQIADDLANGRQVSGRLSARL